MKPDWEAFGRKIIDLWLAHDGGEIDGNDVQDFADETGVLKKVAYSHALHGDYARDTFGVQDGEEWYVRNYE